MQPDTNPAAVSEDRLSARRYSKVSIETGKKTAFPRAQRVTEGTIPLHRVPRRVPPASALCPTCSRVFIASKGLSKTAMLPPATAPATESQIILCDRLVWEAAPPLGPDCGTDESPLLDGDSKECLNN